MTIGAVILLIVAFAAAAVAVLLLVAGLAWFATRPRSGTDPMSLAYREVADRLGLTFVPGRKVGIVSHRLQGQTRGVEVVVTSFVRSRGRYQTGLDVTRFTARAKSWAAGAVPGEVLARVAARTEAEATDDGGWLAYERERRFEAAAELEEELSRLVEEMAA